MSSVCGSYYGEDGVFVAGFTCPKADSDAAALFCCGFNNLKYCCDDPNGFFPNNFGAIALSIAVMLAFALLFSLCILCYFIITTEPIDLDNGLELQATGSTLSPQRPGPSPLSAPAGPQGLKKPFLRGKVDCDNQPQDPERLLQPCFVATETSINVEGPA
uniref:protein shisa-like-2A n=1 Tax=Gasterosteus aculeatus aculeatus TaxID=481459 RepID=UPI001A99ED2B|nr:protein shisa-like-2A [Gasterosteus aculeatus aculeatus]